MQAFITGVSTGIGFACAEKLIQNGASVIGTVRNRQTGEELKKKWGEKFNYLILDVCDHPAIDRLPSLLKAELLIDHLDLLVNNSGIAVAAPFLLEEFSEVEKVIQVNVLGLMKITQTLLPLLGAQTNFSYRPGKIINISSVAGRIGTPFLAAYVASKHAVEGFSHSLRRELLPFGIDVVIVGPGTVQTPIWQKGLLIINNRYKKSVYSTIFQNFIQIAQREEKAGLDVDVIARLVWQIAYLQKKKARYAVVPHRLSNWMIPLLLPHRLLDYLMSRVLKLDKGFLDKISNSR